MKMIDPTDGMPEPRKLTVEACLTELERTLDEGEMRLVHALLACVWLRSVVPVEQSCFYGGLGPFTKICTGPATTVVKGKTPACEACKAHVEELDQNALRVESLYYALLAKGTTHETALDEAHRQFPTPRPKRRPT